MLSAAIVGTALVNAQFDTKVIGTFYSYNVSECASTALPVAGLKVYEIPGAVCTNTPPNPDIAYITFLSYRAGVNPPPGETCYFDVYAGKDCTGDFTGLQITASNNDTCQEVTVGTNAITEGLGAKSVKMLCRT